MSEKFKIMLADRNSRVLDFLRRELTGEAYEILTARDGRELLREIDSSEPLDLLILDLDLAFVSGLELLAQLEGRNPCLPVIIHTYHTELTNHPLVQSAAAIIEKTGNHIDHLKMTVDEILHSYCCDRFAVTENAKDDETESRTQCLPQR